MDVIALAQAGIAEVVAPLGTALTEHQLERLWRLVPVPTLCFDGDAAGQKAALRAAHRAAPLLGPGRSLRFVTLPQGQDPDDLVRARGAAALEALLAEAEPLVDRLWTAEVAAEPLDTPEQRAGLKRRLADLAREGQVLVVTHSPQVAALGGHHWRVEKQVADGMTTSKVVPLDERGRVDEIARMLAGDIVTDAARGAARVPR